MIDSYLIQKKSERAQDVSLAGDKEKAVEIVANKYKPLFVPIGIHREDEISIHLLNESLLDCAYDLDILDHSFINAAVAYEELLANSLERMGRVEKKVLTLQEEINVKGEDQTELPE